MTNRRAALWAVAAIFTLLAVADISFPNLLVSRKAVNPVSYSGGVAAELHRAENRDKVTVYGQLADPADPAVPDKKLIRDAELELVVDDIRGASEQIRKLVDLNRGEIDKLEIRDNAGSASAMLIIRVPTAGLENALAAFKKAGVRTLREQINTRDVSREFYDNEAHLRNLRAEEEQYLVIMKQARTVKDTLDASEKLSDVRDRIERLQAQIQLMTHDIEMSVVTIALTQEYEARAFGVRWRPLNNARGAVRDLLEGLGDWVDSVVAIFIKLPLILLWIVTVGVIGWVLLKIGRPLWMRFVKPQFAHKAHETKTGEASLAEESSEH